MLSTFGGGSIRGFKGAGGESEFIFTGGTAAPYHDSSTYVSYWDSSSIHSHLSGGTYTGTSERVAQTVNTGQTYNLGNRAIFPVIFRMGSESFNTGGSSFSRVYAKICMLYIGSDGNSRLGPVYDLSANDVSGITMDEDCFLASGASNTKFTDSDSKYFIVYPTEYEFDNPLCNSFGISTQASMSDNNSHFYYGATFTVNLSTLAITRTSQTRQSSSSTAATFSFNSPFTNTSGNSNAAVLNGALVAQGVQVIPIPSTDDVALWFGGVANFYGNSTWRPRLSVFDTNKSSEPSLLSAYYENGTHDHIVAGASYNTSSNIINGYSVTWGNSSPVYRNQMLSNASGVTNSSTSQSRITFTGQDFSYQGWHDPETREGYIVNSYGSGAAQVWKLNTDASETNLYGSSTAFVDTKNSGSDLDYLIAAVDGRNIVYYENGLIYNHKNYNESFLSSITGFGPSTSEQLTGNYSSITYRTQKGIIPSTVIGYGNKGGFNIGSVGVNNSTSFFRTTNILAYAGKP